LGKENEFAIIRKMNTLRAGIISKLFRNKKFYSTVKDENTTSTYQDRFEELYRQERLRYERRKAIEKTSEHKSIKDIFKEARESEENYSVY